MKIYIQWEKTTPEDWVEYDTDTKEAIPNDTIAAVCVQGMTIDQMDHFDFEVLSPDGIKVYSWRDDHAQIHEFREIAYHAKVSQNNTNIHIHVYTDNQEILDALANAVDATAYPRRDFVLPSSNTRRTMNGSVRRAAHKAVRTTRGWREWDN